MTEEAAPIPDADVTRLTAEAASKSGLLWVRTPDGRAHPVWHVWHEGGDTGPAAYVVSGPGEQHLPWLPDEVEVVLRSKGSGGRLLTLAATARSLEPGTDAWDAAVDLLRPERLNAVGTPEEVAARWREQNTIHVLTPHGRPAEQPGRYDDSSGAAPVRPAPPTTTGWRPWHWRGRAGARRNTAR